MRSVPFDETGHGSYHHTVPVCVRDEHGGSLFIAYAINRHHIAEEQPPRLFIFSVEVSSGRSLGRGEPGEGW